MQMRDAIFDLMYQKYLESKFDDVFILSNDFGSPKLDDIRQDFGKNFINCGISEQNQIGVGAGMAKFGLYPVFYSIASFYMRAAEQIKVDIAVPNLPCMFLGVGGGYGYSADGPTHHSIEDYGLFNLFDEFSIVVPLSNDTAVEYFDRYVQSNCPTYMRLDREDMQAFQFNKDGFHFFPNQSGGLRECKKTLLVSCGYLGINMLESRSEILADIVLVEDFSAVRDAKFSSLLKTYERVVCVEEHVISSGLGSCLAKSNSLSDVEYELIGLEGRQRFGYNNRAELWKANRIDPGSISNVIRGH